MQIEGFTKTLCHFRMDEKTLIFFLTENKGVGGGGGRAPNILKLWEFVCCNGEGKSFLSFRMGKRGPLELVESTNQIRGFWIPDRWDAWEKKNTIIFWK